MLTDTFGVRLPQGRCRWDDDDQGVARLSDGHGGRGRPRPPVALSVARRNSGPRRCSYVTRRRDLVPGHKAGSRKGDAMGCRRCAAAGRGSGRAVTRLTAIASGPPHGGHDESRGAAPRIRAMSGHSKWASIKHKKAATDAQARPAVHEARSGDHGRRARGRGRPGCQLHPRRRDREGEELLDAQGQHPAGDRPRHRRAGGGDEQIERVLYEGYGPGGVAILVEALTDNRNRTGSEIRHAFDTSRRQPRRARLGGLDVREEGASCWWTRDRYSEDDLIGGDRRRRRGRRPDGDVLKVTSAARGPDRGPRGARGRRDRDRVRRADDGAERAWSRSVDEPRPGR